MKDVTRSVSIRLCTGLMALALASVAVPASAGSITVSTTSLGGQNLSSAGMDHHQAYTWTLNGINIGGAGNQATTASLTFNNFSNWTTAAADPYNILFLSLLNGTQNAQTATTCTGTSGQTACTTDSQVDSTAGGTMNLGDTSNAFQTAQNTGGTGINNDVLGSATLDMVSSGTAITYLGSSRNTADASLTAFGYNALLVGNNPNGLSGTGAFGTTPVTWSYTFNSTQLAALTAYINDGAPVAFGFDPDCHFFMSNITFDMTYSSTGSPVPEPASLTLLATGMAYLWKRRKKNAHAI